MKINKKIAVICFAIIFSIFLSFVILIDIYIINIIKNETNDLSKILLAMLVSLILFAASYVLAISYVFRVLTKEINYDNLTGLGNRRKLYNDMNLLINKSYKFKLCYIDFNEFKKINDLYGHDAGDLLLKEFSKRLKIIYCKNIEGYRVGGDEFVVIIKNSKIFEECIKEIKSICNTKVNLRYNINVELKFSIGVVENDFISDASTLIQFADKKMYEDKKK